MNIFLWPRFLRLFTNDLQIQGKKVLMASAGASVIGLLIYLTVNLLLMSSADMRDAPLYLYGPFFIIGLVFGGLVFTSMIFSDMHHPLEQYLYLTLPVSNFERLLSRYLISGPLFYLYFVAFYYVFELIARYVSLGFIGRASQFFDIGDPGIRVFTRIYFAAHVLMLFAAIYFRSYVLVKAVLTLAAFGAACFVVFWLSMRIIFWDYFPSLGSFFPQSEPPTSFNPAAWHSYIHWAISIAVYLWVLFIAYTTLQDHEA
jgi:hypothetical protein